MKTEQAIFQDILGLIRFEKLLLFINGTGKKIIMIIQKKMSWRMLLLFEIHRSIWSVVPLRTAV
jgi:hypothetical protein